MAYLKRIEENRSKDFLQFGRIDSTVKKKMAEKAMQEEQET